MPGMLRVHIRAARDLPVMDTSSQSTDAYVEVRLKDDSHRTAVCRRSLNPTWSNAVFEFEVNDEDLQDEVLLCTVWDRDTVSSDDSIGHVMIDLHALVKEDPVHQISGWFPLYDTLRGIGGCLDLSVKLTLIKDQNRFRDTSCGMRFFTSTGVPSCYRAVAVHGFVEELMVNDDPEYQWYDHVRTQRKSNEKRQLMFATMDGELRRKIGRKAFEMGGNAVVGYRHQFDLEGDSGLVARAIGTVVTIAHDQDDTKKSRAPGSPTGRDSVVRELELSTPPTTDIRPSANTMPRQTLPMPMFDDALPLVTMCKFPPGFVTRFGGVVVARSIKLLDNIKNVDSPETRDSWWNEVRDEIRSHARALGCNAIIGYSELTSLDDPLFLLTAIGTAAVVNIDARQGCAYVTPGPPMIRNRQNSWSDPNFDDAASSLQQDQQENTPADPCEILHLPTVQSGCAFSLCKACRRPDSFVPEMMLCTVEPPPGLGIHGTGSMIQARVTRPRPKARSAEDAAVDIGEGMPYLEFALHSELINKMKLRGANALFDVRIQVSIGDCMTIAVATATAVHLAALPFPPELAALQTRRADDETSIDPLLRDKLSSVSATHRTALRSYLEDDEISDIQAQAGLGTGLTRIDSKRTFLVDLQSEDAITNYASLLDDTVPDGFFMCSTMLPPGLANSTGFVPAGNLGAITTVKQCYFDPKTFNSEVSRVFEDIFQVLWYRLRHARPCAVCNMRFDTQIIAEGQLQVTMTAIAIRLRVDLSQTIVVATNRDGSESDDEDDVEEEEEEEDEVEDEVEKRTKALTISISQVPSALNLRKARIIRATASTSSPPPTKTTTTTAPTTAATTTVATTTSAVAPTFLSGGSIAGAIASIPTSTTTGTGTATNKPSVATTDRSVTFDSGTVPFVVPTSLQPSMSSLPLQERQLSVDQLLADVPTKLVASSTDAPSTSSCAPPAPSSDPISSKLTSLHSSTTTTSTTTTQSLPTLAALKSPLSAGAAGAAGVGGASAFMGLSHSQASSLYAGTPQTVSRANSQGIDSMYGGTPGPMTPGVISPLHLSSMLTASMLSTRMPPPKEVAITPIDTVPGTYVARHLGPVTLHVIKESNNLRESGGLQRFVSHFLGEMQSLARAHAAARGGDAIVGFRIRQINVLETPSRNQAQCLLSLTGDIVLTAPLPELPVLSGVLESNV